MRRTLSIRPALPAMLLLAGLFAAALPQDASAQSGGVEITPTIGYRWGGILDSCDNALLDQDAELDGATSYGLTIDFPVSRHFQIELLADRQDTDLRQGKLFEPDTYGIGMDVTYFHIGALWQWYPRYAQPFVVVSLGVTELDPAGSAYASDTRFSASLGGGVKVPVSDNIAFRLEFRAFGTDTDQRDEDWQWGDWWDDYCDDHNCDWGNNDLGQASIRVGVAFSF